MSEDVRIQMCFNEERDGWLYTAITEVFSQVKYRNRSMKLKQILALGLTGSQTGIWPVPTKTAHPVEVGHPEAAHEVVDSPPKSPPAPTEPSVDSRETSTTPDYRVSDGSFSFDLCD